MRRVEGAIGALAPVISFFDNFFYVEPTLTFTMPTPAEWVGLLIGGSCLYAFAGRWIGERRVVNISDLKISLGQLTGRFVAPLAAPAVVSYQVPAQPAPTPTWNKMASPEERLAKLGRKLIERSADPHMQEKIATLMAGRSVNH